MGTSSPHIEGHNSPPTFRHVSCGPSGCPSQQLLSSCSRWSWVSRFPRQVFHLFLVENLWRLVEQCVLLVGWPSCHPTISVKVLDETQSINANQRPGLILSLSITGLRMEGSLLSVCEIFFSCCKLAGKHHHRHTFIVDLLQTNCKNTGALQ